MALVPAKCTQCGSSIEVDNTKEAGICTHCGTAFIVEKAINNYNITNNVTNNIHADVVNIVDGNLEDYIRSGNMAYKVQDYKKLAEVADKILNKDPENIDGMFFKTISLSNQFYQNVALTVGKENCNFELAVAALNYAEIVLDNNYRTEEVKKHLSNMFLCEFRTYRKKDAEELIYKKIRTFFDRFNYKPFEYIAKDNGGAIIETQYLEDINLIEAHIKDVYAEDYNSCIINNVRRISKNLIVVPTKIGGYTNIFQNEISIYLKEFCTLTFKLGTDGYVGIYIETTGKKQIYCSLGKIGLFGSNKAHVKEVYEKLKSAGYKIEFNKENEKCHNKLMSILGI